MRFAGCSKLAAVIFESVLAETFEHGRPEIAGGNDAVGIDVIATNGNGGAGDVFACWVSHWL